MDLTPQSSRSPASPFRYTSTPQPLYEYPSPAQSDARYRSTDSLPALGVYQCPMPGANVEEVGSNSHVQVSSSTAWPTASVPHHISPRVSQAAPSNLSADYDPFATFHPAGSASYSQDLYGAQTAVLPSSPVPSGNSSQRSSFSSAPESEIYTQAGSISSSYTPRVKMEGHPEYVAANEPMIMSSPQQLSHSLLVSSNGPYSGALDGSFYQEQASLGWSKVEYPNSQDLPSISTLPIPLYDRRADSQEQASRPLDQRRIPSTIIRTRQPRRLTTKEDANFQCHIKGCGKLFGRSYNFKAHMETHDASREYPFPCPLKDCSKKFVRKTDLQRHHQSVHMKQRNHRCDYCSRFFARKDTLRRHMEDGCSKRFDIETVDFRPQTYSSAGDPNAIRLNAHSHSSHARAPAMQARLPSYGAPAHYALAGTSSQGAHDAPLTSGPGPYLERHDYGQHANPIWTS